MQSIQKELKAKAAETEQLRTSLNSLSLQSKRKEDELQSQKHKLEEKGLKGLEEMKRENEKLRSALESMKLSSAKELTSQKGIIEEKDRGEKKAREALKEKESENAKLRASLESMKQQVEQKEQELKKEREKEAEQERKAKEQDEKVRQQIDDKERENATLRASLESARTRCSQYDCQAWSLHQQAHNLEMMKQAMSNGAREQQQKIDQLQRELQQAKSAAVPAYAYASDPCYDRWALVSCETPNM